MWDMTRPRWIGMMVSFLLGRCCLEIEPVLTSDTENLPGQFAVWAASEGARFLHGRFVPVWWDVDELKTEEVRSRMEEDLFLRIGVVGL